MTASADLSSYAAPKLEGRHALVTGSSSGIGYGMAAALAAAGAKVTLNGIEPEAEGEAAADSLARDAGVERSRVHYQMADLSKVEGVAKLVEAAEAKHGPVDILVNNAGVQFVSPVEDFPPERWQLIIDLNLSAAFHAIRLTFAGMKQRGYGRVINLASAHGLVASPYKSAYVSAKHGVLGLTKTIALEGAEHGVTCNAVCPGYVHTPLVDKQIGDQAKAHGISREDVVKKIMLDPQPTKEFVKVEEIGGFCVFLCGPAGASITGAALPIDGGWTAR